MSRVSRSPARRNRYFSFSSLKHRGIFHDVRTATGRRRRQLHVVRRPEGLASLRAAHELRLVRAAHVADGMRWADRGLVAALVPRNVALRLHEQDVDLGQDDAADDGEGTDERRGCDDDTRGDAADEAIGGEKGDEEDA